MSSILKFIDNYIYFYHIDEFCVIPQYPEEIGDTSSASFNTTPILGRSAPILTYSSSGPRSVTFTFRLHRDMMSDINMTETSFELDENEDVVDKLINTITSAVLPKYEDATKSVNPPIVALRIGDEIYIKGVINGSVSKTFSGPIVDSKYQICTISFTVTEFDPYDAVGAKAVGSFRGLDRTLERVKKGEDVLW